MRVCGRFRELRHYTFTATDQGTHTFSATLKTVPSQSIDATADPLTEATVL
jgi:hypothetical protein